MPLSDDNKEDLGIVYQAAENRELILVETTEKETGERSIILTVAYTDADDGSLHMLPLARMFAEEYEAERFNPPQQCPGCGSNHTVTAAAPSDHKIH